MLEQMLLQNSRRARKSAREAVLKKSYEPK